MNVDAARRYSSRSVKFDFQIIMNCLASYDSSFRISYGATDKQTEVYNSIEKNAKRNINKKLLLIRLIFESIFYDVSSSKMICKYVEEFLDYFKSNILKRYLILTIATCKKQSRSGKKVSK